MRNRRIKKILGAMLAAAIVCQTSASPGVLTVRAETADSVTADSSTADSSAADSAVDEQEQIRHGDMDENTGAEAVSYTHLDVYKRHPEEMMERAKEGYFVRDPERNLVYCPAG